MERSQPTAWTAACLALVVAGCGARTGLNDDDPAPVLLSPGAAGAAGTAGSAGSANVAGRCKPGEPLKKLAAVSSAYSLVLDGDDIYVAQAFDQGGAAKVSKDGGPATTLIAKQGRPYYLAVDAAHVYLTNTIVGQVLQIDKDGTHPVEVAGQQHFPAGIVAREGGIYWLYDSSPGGALMRRLPGDAAPVVVKDALPSPAVLRQRGDVLYMVLHGSGAKEPAVAAMNLATGSFQTLGGTTLQANDLAIADDGAIFYTTNVGAYRLDADGTSTELGKGVFVDGIAVAGNDIYYVERGTKGDGRLFRQQRSGGAREVLADKQLSPRKVAVDDSCVYFTNGTPGGGGGDVVRVAR